MTTASKITLVRVVFIPLLMVFMYLSGGCANIWMWLALAVFILASITDYIDGHIARTRNQVTDFGKFLDPLADKLLVFGAMFGLLVTNRENALFCKVFVWVTFLIIFRELAVTSMRLVVSSAEGIVIAANIWGKMKTVSQIAGIIIIILEPIFWNGLIASFVMMGVMVITTLFSGFSYFKAYWPYINSNK